jgi:signal peptidase II
MPICVSKIRRKRKEAGSYYRWVGVGRVLLIVIAAVVVLIDQLTKAAVNTYMQVGESLPVISGVLHITHVKNAGAAFGLMQDAQPLFLIAAIALIVLISIFHRRIREEGFWMTAALGMVLGGAIGNLIDRVSTGAVTDFIDIRIWPVFNAADSAIVVGVAILGVLLLLTSKDGKQKDNKQTQKVSNREEAGDCSRKEMEINAAGII